ncbi:hypothetical protein D3C71_595350 [compost metagenome]
MARKIDLDQQLGGADLLKGLAHLLRQVAPGPGGQCHHHLGLGRLQQLPDGIGAQQRVDGQHDAVCLRAPQNEVGFGQVRQHIGHHVVWPVAVGMQGVGKAPDLLHQLAVGPGDGRAKALHAGKKRKRRERRVPALAARQHLVGAVWQVGMRKRTAFERFDV